MFDVTGVKVSTVQVSGLGLKRKLSGLSVGMVGGTVHAVGLDPSETADQWLTTWGFAVKVANPGPSPIGIEAIDAAWRGRHRFRARSMRLATRASRGVGSEPVEPPPYDESQLLPLLIKPGEEAVLVVRMQMELGKRTLLKRFEHRSVPPQNALEVNEGISDVKVSLRTHLGRSTL